MGVYFNSTSVNGGTSGANSIWNNVSNSDVAGGTKADVDLAHFFAGNGGGGAAQLWVACSNSKQSGYSGSTNVSSSSYISLVAHEMAHQMGADHTWTGSAGACSFDQWGKNSGVEPGAGITLAGYNGICGNDNIPGAITGNYHHLESLREVVIYAQSGMGKNFSTTTITSAGQIPAYGVNYGNPTCLTNSTFNNNVPVADANADNLINLNIPARTPFELKGSASDADGDPITYQWDQLDFALAQRPLDGYATRADGPLFRSYGPSNDSTRIFPKLNDILTNTQVKGEILPQVDRPMRFAFIVRDGKGGVGVDTIGLKVHDSGSGFAITSQNSGGTLGGQITVTWNVAGTTNAPINCANVDILLSTDGGQTFNTTLASNVANSTGSHNVTLPSINVSNARLKVKCSDNIFFDINNANFVIATPTTCNISSITAGAQTGCNPASNTYTQDVTVTYVDPPSTGMLQINGQQFVIGSSPQTVTLTNLIADGNTVNVTASFTDDGTCSSTVNTLFTSPQPCAACQTFTSNTTPKNLQDAGNTTDIINIPNSGNIIDVNVLNLNGTHSWINDLSFNLSSPNGTNVDIMNRKCGSQDNFFLSLDDQATNSNNTIPCPPVGGGTYQPDNALSAFSGENPQGNWTLTINDAVNEDDGILNGWSLEICGFAICSITALSAGTQGTCNPANNEYTQDIIVTYSTPPSSGTLDVNGQSFAITTSPQTVTLTGLTADAMAVNVTASFSANNSCSLTQNELFTAPANCQPCAISNISAGSTTDCSSAGDSYTKAVTVTYANPPASGTLDVNSQNFAITSSPQTIELSGLASDGNVVNVNATFSADAGCTSTSNALFTAPTFCILCNHSQNDISGMISDSTFISKLTLESDASVMSGNVLYRSPISIELDQDFSVTQGAVFEAQIGDCIDD